MLRHKKNALIVVLLMLVLVAACGKEYSKDLVDIEQIEPNASLEVEDRTTEIAEEIVVPTPPEVQPYTTEALLLAVGDVMMHDFQITAGYDATSKSYNFDHFFTEVKDILSRGDWVIGNLETTTAGAEHKFTGYPMFNAPEEILDALQGAGFNVLTHANNHTLDRREVGVVRTRDALEARGLLTHGTARSEEESMEILVVEKNEITLAIMAYTYGTNGIPIPDGKDYLVNLIDEDKIIADIARAKELDVDLIAVSLHFGVEYQLLPNKEQITLSHNLIRAGADIILGSHPHVVQPYEFVEVTDELGAPRTGVVIYSMGNFISAQIGEERNLGLIFGLDVQKHFPDGIVEITGVHTIPTWVQRYKIDGKLKFRIVPLAEAIDHGEDELLTKQDYQNMQRYLDRINTHVSKMIEEKKEN